MSASSPLVEIDDLTIQYETAQGMLTAVSDASLSIDREEFYGLVGESGCGKSTLAHSIIGGLDDNARIASGTIRFDGTEIQDFSEKEFNRKIRWKEISWIPQGSMSSLDPLERVSDQAHEVVRAHTDMKKQETKQRLGDLFEVMGLQRNRISEYPHQLSGGMKQRAIIALALILEPSVVIADEPTTALDVITQDQIFKYLDKIKETTETTLLLITHDISVVLESCDKMAVMHSGQVAETATTTALYDEPHHPYSFLLQQAFPDHRYPDRTLNVIEGIPPQTIGEVTECTFASRCPWATEECTASAPTLEPVGGDEDHEAACFRTEAVRADIEHEGIKSEVND
jgi:oligopeptide/dipeptide ABC transporter ATP-binding protein